MNRRQVIYEDFVAPFMPDEPKNGRKQQPPEDLGRQ